MLTRNIDLSVGSIVGCTAYFVGTLIAHNNDINPLLALFARGGAGRCHGRGQRRLVAFGRVPSIIVTLGTLAIYRGTLVDLSGAQSVTTDSLPTGSSTCRARLFVSIGGFDIHVLVALALAIVVIFQLAVSYLRFGRRLYAIGSNPDAAELVGLPIRSQRLHRLRHLRRACRAWRASCSSRASATSPCRPAWASSWRSSPRWSSAASTSSAAPARCIGAMLGAVMIGILEQSLFRLQISEFWRDAFLGLLILLAVASDAVILQRLRALWTRTELKLIKEPPADAARERAVMLARLKSWEGLLLAILVVIVAINITQSPYYLGVDNIVNLFQLSIEKIIVALIMTLIIINGEIDLSVASVMGLGACVFACLFHQGLPAPLALLSALLAGLAAGLFNGLWVTFVGLPSLAVTLAGLIGYRGVARILLKDRAIGGFPDWFNTLGQQPLIGPVTLSIIVFFVLFVVVAITLHSSALGRLIYVIGNNQQAARYSGVRVRMVKMTLFAASGTISALAGLLYTARLGSVRGDMASGFELDIITMVLLGGVSIFGGSGNMAGVGLSILVILNLRNGMGLASITGNTQTSVIGALLILSVLVPNMTQSLQNRWKGRET